MYKVGDVIRTIGVDKSECYRIDAIFDDGYKLTNVQKSVTFYVGLYFVHNCAELHPLYDSPLYRAMNEDTDDEED